MWQVIITRTCCFAQSCGHFWATVELVGVVAIAHLEGNGLLADSNDTKITTATVEQQYGGSA
jgi:hypothetical protein